MIKYHKIDNVYHSKIDTDTLELEMIAVKMNRLHYRKAVEDQTFIEQCLASQETGKVEITEAEFLAAKEHFKNTLM